MKILKIITLGMMFQVMQAKDVSEQFVNPRPEFLDMKIESYHVDGMSSSVLRPYFTPKNYDEFNDAVEKADEIWNSLSEKPTQLWQLSQISEYNNASKLVQENLQYHWYLYVINARMCIYRKDLEKMTNNVFFILRKQHFTW